MPWGVAEAWPAAVDVVALYYASEPGALAAESRGRGPRPPEEAREARKMAIHLAILIAECSYAALAKFIGYHRDTICSACADMRDLMALDDTAEQKSRVLEIMVRERLVAGRRDRIAEARARLAALEAIENEEPWLSSDNRPTVIRQPDPRTEKKIIRLGARRSA